MKMLTYATILTSLFLSLPAMAFQVKDGNFIMENLEDYSKCQAGSWSGAPCEEALQKWVKANPADVFKAGKLTRKHMNAWGAIPFFAQAFREKKGDCKDADVNLAVLSALALPKSKGQVVVDAKTLAFEVCKGQFDPDILKETEQDGYVFFNTCKELQKAGLLKLKKIRAQKCEAGS